MVDDEHYDQERSRSIFSALWFRVLIVVLVLGVAAVLAVPYVLDLVSLPSTKQASVQPPRPAMPPPAPPSPPPQPLASAPSPVTPPAPSTSEAASATAAETAKPEPATPPPAESEKPAVPSEEPKRVAKAIESNTPTMEGRIKPSTRPTGRGPYWVQVGAFRDADTAKRLAERLRADKYSVQESTKPGSAPAAPAPTPAPGPSDRYNVFISGTAPADLDARLSAKGLSTETVAGGAMIKPSLPLRDAVTLSRELAGDGLRVQVRRAASETPPSAAPAPTTGDGLHRVRVGSFADRESAMVVLKDLEAKGYKPFLARGSR